MLLNVSKNIDLAEDIGKSKYMEIGRHRDMIANEHIRVLRNSYEKLNAFKYLSSLATNVIYEEMKCRLKHKIHVIINSKHFFVFSTSLEELGD